MPRDTLLPDRPAYLTDIAYSTDGAMLAVSSTSGSIVLWDTDSGQQIGAALLYPTGSIYKIDFSPDSAEDSGLLAAGGEAGTLVLWDLDVDSWISRACERAGRELTGAEWSRYLGNEPYQPTCPIPP